MTREQLVKELMTELSKNGFESFRFEAEQIVQSVCGDCPSITEMSADSIELAHKKLKLRLSNEPLQYILGEWEFYGLPFKVGPGVLIPRQDTETLVEAALPLLNPNQNKVFDLCAGSGCIGITLAKLGGADVTLFEKSDDALRYLRENVRLNSVDADVQCYDVLGDPFEGEADMIVSNPPYIRTAVMETLQAEVKREPKMALDGGEDGLIFYRHIANTWKSALKSGGYLIFEIGFDQGEQVQEILRSAGYSDVKCVKDLCDQDRVVMGRK